MENCVYLVCSWMVSLSILSRGYSLLVFLKSTTLWVHYKSSPSWRVYVVFLVTEKNIIIKDGRFVTCDKSYWHNDCWVIRCFLIIKCRLVCMSIQMKVIKYAIGNDTAATNITANSTGNDKRVRKSFWILNFFFQAHQPSSNFLTNASGF